MDLRDLRGVILALLLAVAAACAGRSAPGAVLPGPPTTQPDPPEAVLARFIDAIEAGRWSQAGGLLSARWRSTYTPSRLQADYAGAGPLAREAAARVQAALRAGTPVQVEDGRAFLPVAGGRALLVAEEGGWRVDALE